MDGWIDRYRVRQTHRVDYFTGHFPYKNPSQIGSYMENDL